ncbi:hypothetical protein BDZ91DRAFT_381316 [Kalaharituber pfeilii]|nr:hypothetical protein BDZ91DRAFT_381316 [Kalaharituber pfeilii]
MGSQSVSIASSPTISTCPAPLFLFFLIITRMPGPFSRPFPLSFLPLSHSYASHLYFFPPMRRVSGI